MNVSMGQLVNDAKELVMRLKEREKNVDQVVIQSNALSKKVDSIQQLENEFVNINETANHRSKVAVLSSIQKENKVIKLLQQENEDLKESLEEHQSVLEIIMSKYRQQMLQLIRLKKQQELSETYFQSAIFKNLQEKTDQIAEMTEVMKHAIELDEKTINETEERLQSLLVENQGLKELLRIRSRYGYHDGNLVSKEVQTDPIEFPKNSKVFVDQKNIVAPFNLREDLHFQNEPSIEITTIQVQIESTMDIDSSNSLNKEIEQDLASQTVESINSEAITVELDNSMDKCEANEEPSSMQVDVLKPNEQALVELTENTEKLNVTSKIEDMVLDEIEDEPKENVPPMSVETLTDVFNSKDDNNPKLESEELEIQEKKFSPELVIKISPSSPTATKTTELVPETVVVTE